MSAIPPSSPLSSPIRPKHAVASTSTSSSALARLDALEAEAAALEKQLDIKRHTELLRTYYERKDATLILIGKVATLEQVTVQEIQARLGIFDNE
ncbi:DNA repair protein, Swi5 family protein [Pseudohyphozyma bogoriensis]|nr:DNA repair protein, Swi5 family protein [Pseudohyphozyma bogoriensis]